MMQHPEDASRARTQSQSFKDLARVQSYHTHESYSPIHRNSNSNDFSSGVQQARPILQNIQEAGDSMQKTTILTSAIESNLVSETINQQLSSEVISATKHSQFE